MARLAGQQHGVVSVEQLRAAGLDRAAIHRRLRAGRLHRLHRGVYAVGHTAVTTHGLYLAAALAAGDGAVVSHRAAAHLFGLVKAPPGPELTTVGRVLRIEGVVVHRTNRLHDLEHSVLDGLPITTVPRTLVDLAATLDLPALSKAVHQAHVRHGTTPAMVERVVDRAPNRPGMGRLGQALRGDELYLSGLEREFVALLRRAGLPLPRTNVRKEQGRVDCHWPETGLTAELDSFRYHATRYQFEADVRRDRRARGRVLRFTWGDVFERPQEVLAELAPLLVQPSG